VIEIQLLKIARTGAIAPGGLLIAFGALGFPAGGTISGWTDAEADLFLNDDAS
jgi:hypothetical protein